MMTYVEFVERLQAGYRSSINSIPFLQHSQRHEVKLEVLQRTKFLTKEGNVHRIGINQRVRDKLPRLPAKKVKASHCIVHIVSSAALMRMCANDIL